ncbi:cation channel sperm-associated protein 1 [Sarcophilus harrisii]|uniref:cation channel sperm-associated protein 1 n=1 Tax=Sarcophilus harrisii TaxID=9305 RepID=UPI000C7CDE5D|nr:cation channel sperm-associated protein 1 [Sarcophilus harrisii]XP_031798081.1 cation channel sperm-associated protein 1 [Sarcophilus harrisii]
MNYLTVPEEIRREVDTPESLPVPVTLAAPLAAPSAMSHSRTIHIRHPPRSSWNPKSKPSRSGVRIQPSYSSTGQNWEQDHHLKMKRTRIQRTRKKQIAADELLHKCCGKVFEVFLRIQFMLAVLVQSLIFEIFIFIVVCLNTTVLVVQTFAEVEIWGEWYFTALDSIFLCIYFMEALLKIIVMGLGYFDSWNSLDFFIMVMAMVDFVLKQIYFSSVTRMAHSKTVFGILKIFKSLRALRVVMVLRRLSFLNSLQEVTGTLAGSLPSIGAILVLMFTCLFFFSVIFRSLFNQSDPKRFQNIFTTIFTLFTMLTLDDWSLIYLSSRDKGAWYIVPILMIYIIIQYFIFLNLVIAVLVDNFQMALLKGLEKEKQKKVARMHERLLDESLTILEKEPEENLSGISLQIRIIEKKYGDLTESQQEQMFHYLQLMAAVEHHQQVFRSQAAVIDEIIDKVFEAGEEDFKK